MTTTQIIQLPGAQTRTDRLRAMINNLREPTYETRSNNNNYSRVGDDRMDRRLRLVKGVNI